MNIPEQLASLCPETRQMTDDEFRGVIAEAVGKLDLNGKRVLAIIPDSTRTAPTQLLCKSLCEFTKAKAAAMDFLVALGTHIAMDDSALSKLTGLEVTNEQAGEHKVINHRWECEETFSQVGTITAEEVKKFSEGLLDLEVPVKVNRMAVEYDLLIVCGPVFPHEVVGFSGGNKYFYPGISGRELINVTHWMGALLTSMKTIGTPDTPMRRMINHAASLIPTPRVGISMVMHGQSLVGCFAGQINTAWAQAMEVSRRLDIVWCEKPYKRVLAVMPELYDDLWTGAKGMYKLEPVIADNGEVIIYAPHIDEVSYAHGDILDEIGYHVRDYFLAQWDKFKDYPWGVLAHSTHLRGSGTYIDGAETPRVNVSLATSISPERCKKIGLKYIDPETIDIENWAGREDEGVLLVRRAGEMLYKLKQES